MNKLNALPKKKVGYFDGVIVYLFAILANLGAQFIVGFVGGGLDLVTGKNVMTSDYFQLVCMLVFQLAFLAVPIIYCTCVKKVRPQLLSPITKPAPEVFLSIALPFITLLGFFLPAQYFGIGLDKIGYNLNPGVDLSSPGKMVLGIIVMCVAAPIAEELIFRGFLLSGLKTQFNDYVAALLCALSFTFMHMNPEQTVYQFFLGYTCALTALKCRNLIAPMIIHSLSNLVAVLLGIPVLNKLVDKAFVSLSRNTVAAVLVTVALAVAAGALIFCICYVMNKIRSRREACAVSAAANADDKQADGIAEEGEQEKTAQPENKKLPTILYWVTVGLCAIMWITVFVSSMITLPTV